MLLENKIRKTRRVPVSSNHQITIPEEFADAIGIGDEVTVELLNNRLVVRPASPNPDDFSEEILSELIDEGYEGEELKKAFAERRAQISGALENLVEEARQSKSYDSFEEMLDDTEK